MRLPLISSPVWLLGLFLLVGCSADGGDPDSPTEPPPDDGPSDPQPDPDDDTPDADLWISVFDGADSDVIEAVILTSDGGYLASGTTLSSGQGDGDAWLLKVDPGGTVVWQRTFGGPGYEMGYDVKETPDGGFVVAGLTESATVGGQDLWVFKVDASGNLLWEKSYGGAGQEQGWSIDLFPDGGYLIAGGTTSFGAGGSDLWLLRLDASGDVVWQKAFGGPADDAPGGEYDEYVARAFLDRNGDIVASTVTHSFGSGDSDVWVLKLDLDGVVLWEYAYGDEDEDGMWMAGEHAGGGYFIPGFFTPTTDYDTDLWGLSLRPDGSIAWQKSYGIAGVYDEALSVGMTADGGALIGGSYYEPGDADWSWTLTRVGSDGTMSWARRYERGFDWPNAVAELPGGEFVVAGVTMTSLADQEDLMLMRTDAGGAVGASCTVVGGVSVSEEVTSGVRVASAATVTETSAAARSVIPGVENSALGHGRICSQ